MRKKGSEPTPNADTTAPSSEPTPEPTPAVTGEPEPAYEYNPHLFIPMILDDVPQDYWDSFHNLCDALLAGETTFERFEELVAGVLNEYLDADDDDFEKSLKLYNYMESNYTYNYDFIESKPDGYVYYTIMNHSGQCVDLGSVYAFFLLQAGVEAVLCGGQSPDMGHDWTYLVIDGQGYFSDPTWSLKVSKDDPLELYYFLMDAERRAETGFDIENLQVSLLPRYWVSFSSFKPTADSDEYCFPYGSYLISLDEDNKTVHYFAHTEEHELSYAHERAAD